MIIYPKNKNYEQFDLVFFKLSQKELSVLNEEASSILEKIKNGSTESLVPRNEHLIGYIENEYTLSESTTSHIESILRPAIQHYIESNPHIRNMFLIDKEIKNIVIKKSENAWINFQKKFEHNPLHRHFGFLSFVIWLKIPYKFEDEKKYNISKKYPTFDTHKNVHSMKNGDIIFVQSASKNIIEYPISINEHLEGSGVLFSSDLYHMVYPFYTSDEYRISVSGNFKIKLD